MSRIFCATDPRKFAQRRTRVFWDMEDASIFERLDPGLTVRNIKKNLRKEGYSSFVTFLGYVDENILSEELLNKCWDAGVPMLVAPKAKGVKSLDLLFVNILSWANKDFDGRPMNMLVLSKRIREGSKYAIFLEASKSEYLNVGLADPDTFLNLDPEIGSSQAPMDLSGSSQAPPVDLSGGLQAEEQIGLCADCSKG